MQTDTVLKRDIRLRFPGFRRYAADRERLEATVAERDALHARVVELERELRGLRASRGLAPGNEAAIDDAEWVARAKQFEYYWLNAQKKIDLLAMRPFGHVAMGVLREGRTCLNADRLYMLWQAVTGMPSGAGAVVEVGAFKGGSAKLIAEAMIAANLSLPFYVCDTFAGHTVVNESLDGRHRVGKGFHTDPAKVARYLKGYEFLEVVEGDIRDTVSRFPEQYAFGMVHLDVDVHPITDFCLTFFAPRVVVGAAIVVDDYGFITCRGAKKAVDDFLAEHHGQFRAMHLLTGQAVLTRLA
jgi:hypothetical protein